MKVSSSALLSAIMIVATTPSIWASSIRGLQVRGSGNEGGAGDDGISSYTANPCDGVEMTISITTDEKPKDTKWGLTNLCDDSKVNLQGSNYVDSNTLHAETHCLPDGKYAFYISDYHGDGICCKSGNGSYKVQKDGVVQISGGKFGSEEVKEFGNCGAKTTTTSTIPAITTTTPTPCDGVEMTISITTDEKPKDTKWGLTNLCDDSKVYLHGSNYVDSNTLHAETHCLPDGKYAFYISDYNGDGICCEWGNGSYVVQKDGVLQISGGKFGSEEVKEFGNCDVLNCATLGKNQCYETHGLCRWQHEPIKGCFPNESGLQRRI